MRLDTLQDAKEKSYILTIAVHNNHSSKIIEGKVVTQDFGLSTNTIVVHGRELFHQLVTALKETDGQ